MADPQKKRLGFQSSLFAYPGTIAVALAGAVLAWWAGFSSLGILLLAAGVTGLICRLWGMRALSGMEVCVLPEREELSVGETVKISYTVANNKSLPLVWAELLQDVPVRECLVPDGSFRRREYAPEEAERMGRSRAYERRFSFLGGRSSLSWDTIWTGQKRGVTTPGSVTLHSGDGLGLTQISREFLGLQGHTLVVWPRLIPVDTGPFLRSVWSGEAGRAGWSEDPTVVKGERDYQPGDPWKHIDWRSAARTDELKVRQFDTVTPQSVLFLLDSASLEDPEEGISVTASLIHALSGTGIACGLALPGTGARGPLLLDPADPAVNAAACLFALAEFEAESATARFDQATVLSAAATAGQTWLVAQGAGSLACPGLAALLSGTGARLLAARRESGGIPFPETRSFSELIRKEAVR